MQSPTEHTQVIPPVGSNFDVRQKAGALHCLRKDWARDWQSHEDTSREKWRGSQEVKDVLGLAVRFAQRVSQLLPRIYLNLCTSAEDKTHSVSLLLKVSYFLLTVCQSNPSTFCQILSYSMNNNMWRSHMWEWWHTECQTYSQQMSEIDS